MGRKSLGPIFRSIFEGRPETFTKLFVLCVLVIILTHLWVVFFPLKALAAIQAMWYTNEQFCSGDFCTEDCCVTSSACLLLTGDRQAQMFFLPFLSVYLTLLDIFILLSASCTHTTILVMLILTHIYHPLFLTQEFFLSGLIDMEVLVKMGECSTTKYIKIKSVLQVYRHNNGGYCETAIIGPSNNRNITKTATFWHIMYICTTKLWFVFVSCFSLLMRICHCNVQL